MEISKAVIDQANDTDLKTFLELQGWEFKKAGTDQYRWKVHESLVIRGNKWIWNKTGQKGYPIAFVMEFFHLPFREAVFFLTGSGATPAPAYRPAATPKRTEQFRLPDRDTNNDIVIRYLIKRSISPDIINLFIDRGDLYQSAGRFHNAVFIGRDMTGTPQYFFERGTHDWIDADGVVNKFRHEPAGTDRKRYNFANKGTDDRLCVFESCIDLCSFLTLFPQSRDTHLLSLGGLDDAALLQYTADHPDIRTVYFCLDNDQAGQNASVHLAQILPAAYTVGRLIPALKDWNELLQNQGTVPKLYNFESVPTN